MKQYNFEEKVFLRDIMGSYMSELGKKYSDIVVVNADLMGTSRNRGFVEMFPERSFNVGIAEQNMVSFAAGLAKEGMKPYFAVYSSFLQRGYDQVIHDVSITKKNVTFLIDRAGLVGNDGETHHGVFDLSYLNIIPNITVMAPKDIRELDLMLDLSREIDGPVAIRYPRGNTYYIDKGSYNKIKIGTYEVLEEGKDVLVLAIGNMVKKALNVREILLKDNINPTIVNARFLKPMDENLLHELLKSHSKVVTIEDNVVSGGFGSRINKFVIDNNYNNIKIENIGIPDKFVEHGNVDELFETIGMSDEQIAQRIKNL